MSVDSPLLVATVEFPGAPMLLQPGDNSIWVSHSNGLGDFAVSEVSIATNDVMSTLPLDGVPVATAFDSGFSWVAVNAFSIGGSVQKVAEGGSAVEEVFKFPYTPRDLAVQGSQVWMTTDEATVVLTDAGVSVPEFEFLPRYEFVSAAGQYIYFAKINGLIQRYAWPAFNRPFDTDRDVGPNIAGLFAEDSGDVFVTKQIEDEVTLKFQRLQEAFGFEEGTTTSLALGSGDFYVAQTSMGRRAWVSQNGASETGGVGSLIELDPQMWNYPMVQIASIPVGVSPAAVAVMGDTVWVANFDSNNVMRLE